MLQRPRGTADRLPEDAPAWQRVHDAFEREYRLRGFQAIATPTFEPTELFARTTGETTDIVQKEMYTFEDRGGDSLTLRPEGTPSVVRAYLQNGLHV
ncbi:MAG: ATP phosphoribosyltransferase regulatory subunit, partial [Actinobacteria bacterium]|nr:ATP phosphoribosyltransferase regulatory subunit [Actinomycetota bacterium]